jgi:hypothetical protein
MTFRIKDIIVLELRRTKVVANPMAIPLMAEFVTANTGHKPRSDFNTGFSSHKPFSTSYVTDTFLAGINYPIHFLLTLL